MTNLFDSLINVVSDTVKVVAAPVEIALDLTAAVTKPLADGATAVTQTVKELTGTDDRKHY